MDKTTEGFTGASISAEEDPKLPPSGAGPHNQTGRFRTSKGEGLFVDSKKAFTEEGFQEEGFLFDPANYSEGEHDEMLKEFFETSAPSTAKRSDGIRWIRVISASYKEEGLTNEEELTTDWKKLKNSGKMIDFDAIKQLAIRHRYLGGNWFSFFDTGEEIDNAWEKIAKATVRDELGTHAKVTPCEDTKEAKARKRHVISVYTKDFTDKDDVMKVEAKLRKLGFRKPIDFKPRVYATLGIYSKNQWGLSPSIYVSNWDPKKVAVNIQDRT
ncbi:UPF0696 protein C11orf68 homolog [Patiria miniata]|uniref:Uncharacterized protein n=1 Tax=Patiria miniata TaxID=46514 RepID=A0A914B6W1_PATMI|nr:UPF0696 protein C11orf68 homolog [Patiria miniata]